MKKGLFYILILLFTLSLPAQAQTKKELEAKKKHVMDELATTNKILKQTQKDKKGTENKIQILGQSIKKSNELINTLNSEILLLQRDIDSLETTRQKHQDKLTTLLNQYALSSTIQYQKHKYFSPMTYILSSKNFNEAYRRFIAMRLVNHHRKLQAEQIAQLTEQLKNEQEELNINRATKENALNQKSIENARMEKQRKEQQNQLSHLQKKEKELKAKQKKQQEQANQLNKKIQDIIAQEIKKQQKSTSAGKPTYELSKEEKLIAGNFAANKGKLPRPIEKGFISGHFGTQPHPVLDKVTVNNKGIYLQTPTGADARTIFDGEVTQIFSIPGSNTSIIIKHGNYRTVYSNLSTVYVKVGDKVSTRQKIGQIYTDKENDNKTELFFSIYKDTDLLNPESWLAL